MALPGTSGGSGVPGRGGRESHVPQGMTAGDEHPAADPRRGLAPASTTVPQLVPQDQRQPADGGDAPVEETEVGGQTPHPATQRPRRARGGAGARYGLTRACDLGQIKPGIAFDIAFPERRSNARSS